jgi:PAS domain S-box-containing protein
VIAGGMVYVFTRQMHRVMAHDRQNQRRLAEVNRHLHQQILAQDRLRKTLESFQNPLQSIIRDVPLVMFSGGQGSAFTLMDQRGLQLLPPFNGVLPGSDPLKAALLRGESFHSLSGDGERYYETFLSPVHNAGGSLIAVLGVALDVTEQQRTRQALVDSEEIFRRMVEHSPDVILVMSEQDSRILHVNPIIEPVLGYAPAAIVGAHIETLLATAPAQGQATDLIAFRRADDSICLMEQSAHNIPWPAQMAVMLTLRDVTEREKVRADKLAALQMQQEVEQHQARIRAQENFINVIVHQIRSPLTTILMSTDTLRDYADRLTEAQKLERLKKIARQALRMNEMLNDLLMVRQGMLNVLTFEPQPLLLDDFCQEFGDAVQNSETGNHTFGYANRSGIACALLDARLLYHILDNLIRNAIKYSPAGGRISLTIGLEEDWLLFQVQDAGLGIPAAALPGLFQLFYRADNVKHIRGTGIGLVIVRDCVQAHRGSVAVDSVAGQGTTFTVRLPCVVAEVSSPSADEKSGR